MACGTSQAHRAQLRALRLRRSAAALSTTQSRPDEEGSDSGGRQWRGLFRSESVVDGPLGIDTLSRLVLSTRDAGTVAHYQASGFVDLAEPLPDQQGHRTQQMKTMRQKTTKTVKGDQTKTLILETALEMFRERGYDETTMRAVAQKAGVSLGNAYYYFHSKEYLIQAFYQRTHEEHLTAAVPALEHEKTLKARLLTMMRTKIDTMEPYHQFAGVLFKT